MKLIKTMTAAAGLMIAVLPGVAKADPALCPDGYECHVGHPMWLNSGPVCPYEFVLITSSETFGPYAVQPEPFMTVGPDLATSIFVGQLQAAGMPGGEIQVNSLIPRVRTRCGFPSHDSTVVFSLNSPH